MTGTRAEYGLLKSTMKAISRHPELNLQLVVTGMHLLRKFGYTLRDILRDGQQVDARVRMQAGDDGALDQAAGLARGVTGIARFCEERKTDIVVVLGDRIEAMAGALASITTGRVLAHVHGGDLAPGDFDDSFRHAITKLAHLHLVASRSAQRRLIRMGEYPERVHCVGAPGLDRLREIIGRRRGTKQRSDQALILHHATGRSPERERRTMNMILRSVRDTGLARTVVYPNTDRGHTGVIQAIEDHRRRCGGDSLRVFRSLDRDTYLRMLLEAQVLVGNSSSGIIEAGVAGTPAVDVGDRQRGREPGGPSVVHAEESYGSIREALSRALRKRPIIGRSSVYGSGSAGTKIAGLLAGVPLDDAWRRKVNAY